jgi:hypothetical protein
LLILLQIFDILFEAYPTFFDVAFKTAQFNHLLLVLKVHRSLLNENFKILVPTQVSIRIFLGIFLEMSDDPFADNLPEFGNKGTILIVLS